MQPADIATSFMTDEPIVVLPPGRHEVHAPIELTRSIIIRGAEDGSTVLDGKGTTAPFVVRGTNPTVSFENFTVQSGAGCQGGAIVALGPSVLQFECCRFIGNRSQTAGGAALLYQTRGVFRDCIFERNSSVCGGALGLGRGSEVILYQCMFVDNKADAGGAIFVDDLATIEVYDCAFIRNVAAHRNGGDALYLYGSANETRITNLSGRRGVRSDRGSAVAHLTDSLM